MLVIMHIAHCSITKNVIVCLCVFVCVCLCVCVCVHAQTSAVCGTALCLIDILVGASRHLYAMSNSTDHKEAIIFNKIHYALHQSCVE